MTKYLYYILTPIMIIVMYKMLPQNWKKTRPRRILLAFYGISTILSFTAMISAPKLWHNYIVRNVVDYIALVLFIVAASVILVFIVRYMLVYIAIRVKAWSASRLLLGDGIFAVCTLICTLFFLAVGTIHFNDIRTVTKDINITDGQTNTAHQTSIALLADIHLGAGANNELVDVMIERLKEQRPEIIVISGDIVDMTTLYDDLHYFAQRISEPGLSKYGVYYAEGNHEADSDLDVRKELEAFGVTCLYDEAVELENGLVIAGRKNSMEKSVEDILRDSSVRENAPVVVLSHRPKKLKEMSDKNCLVLCGHIHAFTIPLSGFYIWSISELPYGYHEFGDLKAITSAGTAGWGYRIKYPSYNEIWKIRLTY